MENPEVLHQAHAHTNPSEAHNAPVVLDDEGWLSGYDVSIVPSVRSSALWPGETNVLGVVWHYTDTRSVGAVQLAQRIQNLAPGDRAASWHVCIDRSGIISQSVSAKRGSWHAGGPSAARFEVARLEDGHRVWSIAQTGAAHKPGANSLFFGIELENVGEVRPVNGEWLGWPFVRGDKARGEPVAVPPSEVCRSDVRSYHDFTESQVAAAGAVIGALAARYKLIRSNCAWTHQTIDPQNRTDPGPVWVGEHLPLILDATFG